MKIGSVRSTKRTYFTTCPVQGCPTRTARKGFYLIPEKPDRRQAWLDACKLPQSTARTAKICYRHFLISDFRNEQTEESISQFQFGRLKENVVPSQNLPKFATVVETNLDFSLGSETIISEENRPETSIKDHLIGDQVLEIPLTSVGSFVESETPQNESCNDHDYTPVRSSKKSTKNTYNEQEAIIRKLRKQNQLLRNQNNSLRKGNLPLAVKKRAANDLLKGKFTPTKIEQLLKPIKTKGVGKGPYRGPRCNKWKLADLGEGMLIKHKSGPTAYNQIRKQHNFPLPGISTLNKSFR